MKRPGVVVSSPDRGEDLDGFQREIVELLPRLRRLARAITRDVADADDLTQLTVERALVRADQWAPGTRLDGGLPPGRLGGTGHGAPAG